MTDSAQEQDQHEDQEGASGPPGASEDELDEIEEERERRLAPENRPENTEIDNTGDNAPDLSRVDPEVDENAPAENAPAEKDSAEDAPAEEEEKDAGDEGADDSESSGPPGASEDELDEIEEERKRRLAPENRPENTEIDNTGDNAPDLSRVDPEVDEDG